MYRKIENEFKKLSGYKKSQLIYVLFMLLFALFAAILIVEAIFDIDVITIDMLKDSVIKVIEFIVIATTVFVLLLGLYIFDRIVQKVYIKEHLKAGIKCFSVIWNSYLETTDMEDINLLIKILQENEINTAEQVEKALNRYRNQIPQRNRHSLQIASVLTITLSSVTLLLNHIIDIKFIATIFFVIVVLVLYILLVIFNRILMKIVCKNGFYARMEYLLSEISVKELIK